MRGNKVAQSLFLTAKHKLRPLPPLTIGDDEIDEAVAMLEGILTAAI